MSKADRRRVGLAMADLARGSEDFAVIYRFFQDLSKLDGHSYIILCRTRMPLVADAILRATDGALKDSSIIQAMKAAPQLTDKEVVDLSAITLELVTKTVSKAILDQDKS